VADLRFGVSRVMLEFPGRMSIRGKQVSSEREYSRLTEERDYWEFSNALSVDLPPRSGFLGVGSLILHVHGKYSEIGKGMFSIKTPALKIHIELST
jgi:hypothetical protein